MATIRKRFEKLKASIPVLKSSVLSDGEVQSVFLTFPALLVAHSDGIFDEKEQCEVYSICEQLVSDDLAANLKSARAAEIYHVSCSLIAQQESCKDEILALIRDDTKGQAETKALLLNMINGVAEASDGISDVEQRMIDTLKKELHLEEKN